MEIFVYFLSYQITDYFLIKNFFFFHFINEMTKKNYTQSFKS